MSIASRPARALILRRLAGVLGLALAAWGFVCAAAAQEMPPAPRRPITDNAPTYNPYYLDMTEAELRRWQAKTRHPVVIWTEKRIPGRDFDDWCRETFERWRTERGNLSDGAALFLSTEEKKVRLEVGPGLRALLPGDAEARIAGVVEEVRRREKDPKDWDNPIIWTIYALTHLQNWLGRIPEEPRPAMLVEEERRRHQTFWETSADFYEEDPVIIVLGAFFVVVFVVLLVTHPLLTLGLVAMEFGGSVLGGSSSAVARGVGAIFKGAGGSFGGGGSSGKW